MNRYIFALSISPVQSFISQARKVSDLNAGSSILSELIDNAMKYIGDKADIIFPGADYPSKPNRLVALIETENPNKYGKQLEGHLKLVFSGILDRAVGAKFPNINPASYNMQKDNFLQIYWAFLPYNGGDYRDVYIKLESMLGGVKNTRVFEQQQENGRKCSVCGERNAIVYNKSGNKKPLYIQDNAVCVKNSRLSDGEGLCAVCLAKRYFENEEKFNESTAYICLMDFLSKFKATCAGVKALDEYRSIFDKYGFDDELFYNDNLNSSFFLKNGYEALVPKIDSITNALRKVLCAAEGKQPKYYSIMVFDGDSMGRWLSGSFINFDRDTLMQFQKDLSLCLGKFAKAVTTSGYFNFPCGKWVYSGGDDLLGFINLKYLFQAIKYTRKMFSELVNKPLKDKYGCEKDITFSAGIAIAHYKAPLKNVMGWARDMEQKSKSVEGKDAFSIAMLKHSGGINNMTFKWGDDYHIVDILDYICNEIRCQHFSNTFIKSLEKELNTLYDGKTDFDEPQLIRDEIKRLVARSCMVKKVMAGDENNASDIIRMQNMVWELFEASNPNEKDSLRNFIGALNMVDFMQGEV